MLSADQFPAAAALILDIEGPPSNDPNDPGGETVFGIARNEHPEMFVNGPPTKDAALAFYRQRYWDRWRCGEMPWGWALAIFDCAVNQAESIAGELAQRALRLNPDNDIGPTTLAAIAGDKGALLDDFFARRALRYAQAPAFHIDGHGWLRRLFTVHRSALHG